MTADDLALYVVLCLCVVVVAVMLDQGNKRQKRDFEAFRRRLDEPVDSVQLSRRMKGKPPSQPLDRERKP